jgi:hypothetical protein
VNSQRAAAAVRWYLLVHSSRRRGGGCAIERIIMPTLIEKHLAYVENAVVQSQKRQAKLWKTVSARRGKDGTLPLTEMILDEYIAAARMTASLMIDIEMVREEYLAEKAAATPKRGARKKKVAARKKR